MRHSCSAADHIAVGPDGTVYVTWDYGPNRTSVTFLCSPTGSCGFGTGDLNAVMQKSNDGGKTFEPMTYVSPGFPASGGDSAPMVVEPNGRIDVLYRAKLVGAAPGSSGPAERAACDGGRGRR
jgi:hypothetical protein